MSNVVKFDGTTGWVNLGANASLDLRDALTICMRLYNDSKDVERYPISSDQWFISLSLTAREMYFYTFGAVSSYMVWGKGMPLYRPVHLACSYDRNAGANNRRTYLDGNKTGQTTTTGALVAPATNKFLSRYYSSVGYLISGYIAEVQVYNRQLSDEEIAYNYAHPSNPIRRGLVLNLTQESIQGAQWLDLSGNANHGTYVGGAVPQRANLVTQR